MNAAELLAFFRERGWSIAMDDRPGQALWPFDVLAAALSDKAAQPWALGHGDAAALSGVPEGAAFGHGMERDVDGLVVPDWATARARGVPEGTASEQGLDVERLARALHAMPHHYRGGADNELARMACQQMSPSACERKAASIAREYARLAAPQPVPEEKP